MRLFIALDIPSGIRAAIARFQDALRPLASDARWVSQDSFHITLKFIGEQSPARLDALRQALSSVHARSVSVSFRQSGFFPNERSARVFWVGIEAGPELAELAMAVDQATATLAIPREKIPFTPHLTLARAGQMHSSRGPSGSPSARPGDRPNQRFFRVQEKLAKMEPPEFGTMTASEFFLYESRLSPRGAQYTKLARFALS